MNTKLAIPFLATLALAQGCIIVGPGGPDAGDVTFNWTFGGMSSCSAAGVANVHINIPGETLENGGVYPCNSNGYNGIVLHNFAGGTYTYTIEGLDTAGYTIYTSSGDFSIDGSVLENVDLTPYGQAPTYAIVTWTFPGNVTCRNADTPADYFAGVKYVDIDVDGSAVRASCADGSVANGGQGVYTAYVPAGAHTITLTALGAYTPTGGAEQTYALFGASHSLTTTVGTPVTDQVALKWLVGGMVVGWSLQSSTGSAQTCTGTGNPYVYVNFVDSTNTAVYPNPGDTNVCNAAPTRYFYLYAAATTGTNYRVDMSGATSTATWSQVGAHPVYTVMPGVFPADTQVVNVALRQN